MNAPQRPRARAPLAPLLLLALLVCAPRLARAEGAHGRHVRIAAPAGPIHVWAPAGYEPDTAGIVVYVHGYFVDVDRAWRAYHIARQFADSKRNALFIACTAPSSPEDPVAWPSLSALLDTVAERLGERMPEGRVVAVGHSAAHRTLATWIEDDRLDTRTQVDHMRLVTGGVALPMVLRALELPAVAGAPRKDRR